MRSASSWPSSVDCSTGWPRVDSRRVRRSPCVGSIFRLYALLKVHLAEEKLYLGIIEQGVSAEGAEALAAAMEHAGTSEF